MMIIFFDAKKIKSKKLEKFLQNKKLFAKNDFNIKKETARVDFFGMLH